MWNWLLYAHTEPASAEVATPPSARAPAAAADTPRVTTFFFIQRSPFDFLANVTPRVSGVAVPARSKNRVNARGCDPPRGYRQPYAGVLPASGSRNGRGVLVLRQADLPGLHDEHTRRDALPRMRARSDAGAKPRRGPRGAARDLRADRDQRRRGSGLAGR